MTAWSYIFASIAMVVAAVSINAPNGGDNAAATFVCPGCDSHCGGGGQWAVPTKTILALAYWILFTSIAAYYLMTWANKYAHASLVSAYTTMQPVTAAVLCLVLQHFFQITGLNGELSLSDLGGLGIVAGLALVVYNQYSNGDGVGVDDGIDVGGSMSRLRPRKSGAGSFGRSAEKQSQDQPGQQQLGWKRTPIGGSFTKPYNSAAPHNSDRRQGLLDHGHH